MRRVVFRADGNSHIGLGHVVRSLAMAAMLRNDFQLMFAIQQPSFALEAQIRSVCDDVMVLPDVANSETDAAAFSARLSGNEVVVLDGYGFDAAYQTAVKAKGCKLICIDDIMTFPFVADAIINYTGGINIDAYEVAPYTSIYSGPEYILLRPPFLEQRSTFDPASVQSVVVCLGGSDFQDLTTGIVSDLKGIGSIREIAVVTGTSYLYQNRLMSVMAGDERVQQYHNLDADAMAQLMKRCGTAILSPSGVAYEYLSLGGVLLLKQYADNQSMVRSFLLNQEVAFDYSIPMLQNLLVKEAAWGQQLVQRQTNIFDGKSPERIKAILAQWRE